MMGSKANPGTYDCHAKAESDEPMFTLLARDATAPLLVREWARMREAEIQSGHRPEADLAKVAEAHQCADAMIDWRKKNRASS